jgi:hypothetical protein
MHARPRLLSDQPPSPRPAALGQRLELLKVSMPSAAHSLALFLRKALKNDVGKA